MHDIDILNLSHDMQAQQQHQERRLIECGIEYQVDES